MRHQTNFNQLFSECYTAALYLALIILGILFPVAVLLKTCSGGTREQEKSGTPGPPNIIFFIADDMARDMFNCRPGSPGDYLTPNMDRLAEEGVVMMGQHVSSTVCTPSRFSCLTGLYASRAHNPRFIEDTRRNAGQTVVSWNTKIVKGDRTIASLLNELGYYTGAVGKNHVIDVSGWVKVPLEADTSDASVMETLKQNNRLQIEAFQECGFDYADGLSYDNPYFNGPMALARHNLDWTTAAALKFLESARDSVFFLYYASGVPHGPTSADRSWNADRRVVPYGVLDSTPSVLPPKETIPRRLIGKGLATQEQIPDNKANMLWLDDAFGAILEKLKEIGAYDNTIIIFFNDHGIKAKGTAYRGGTETTSVIWKKGGFQTNRINETLVSNIDFAPTLLDLAGGRVDDKGFDGKSFRALLEGDTVRIHESLYFEIGYSRAVLKENYKYMALRYPENAAQISLRERKRRLDQLNEGRRARGFEIRVTDPETPFGQLALIPGGHDTEYRASGLYPNYYDADQLYHLVHDPGEQHNLANDPDHEAILEELKKELEDYLDDLPGTFGESR